MLDTQLVAPDAALQRGLVRLAFQSDAVLPILRIALAINTNSGGRVEMMSIADLTQEPSAHPTPSMDASMKFQ